MLNVQTIVGGVELDRMNGIRDSRYQGYRTVHIKAMLPLANGEFYRSLLLSSATACRHSPNQPAVLGAFAGASRSSRPSSSKSFATSMS